MGIVHFVAGYWWVWMILAICSYGIFFTILSQAPAMQEAWKEGARTAADDETGFVSGARVGQEATKKRQAEINAQTSSPTTALAYLGTKVFGVLLLVGGLLRLFGFGA